MPHEHCPLDPDCPAVEKFHTMHDNDPISQSCGCMDDIIASFEKQHRRNCERCKEYGAANIEIEY